MIREIRFLETMTAGILSNRRKISPFGLQGGSCGTKGKNQIKRSDGNIEELGSTETVEMKAGDIFIIQTPGGGGYGNKYL